jgi:hypothetical protein
MASALSTLYCFCFAAFVDSIANATVFFIINIIFLYHSVHHFGFAPTNQGLTRGFDFGFATTNKGLPRVFDFGSVGIHWGI